MGEDNRERRLRNLRAPFPKEAIKSRKQAGRALSYIQGADVVNRLLDCIGLDWSWQIMDWKLTGEDKFAVVHGRLTVINGVVSLPASFDAVGAAPVLKGDVENALKSAAKDALKVAASLIGVALHLYPSYYEFEEEPAQRAQPPEQPTSEHLDSWLARIERQKSLVGLNEVRNTLNAVSKTIPEGDRMHIRNAVMAKMEELSSVAHDRSTEDTE